MCQGLKILGPVFLRPSWATCSAFEGVTRGPLECRIGIWFCRENSGSHHCGEGGGCVGAVLRHSRGWKIPHPPDIEKTPYLFDIVEQYKGRPVNINDNRLIIDVFL